MRTIAIFCALLGSLSGFAQSMVKMEYFIDSDPGYGQATTLMLPAQNQVADFGFSIPIPAETEIGLHVAGFRTCDSNGVWGQTNFHTFQTIDAAVPAIVGMEYYWDADPGFGNGQFLSVNNEVQPLSISAPFDLTPGLHNVFFRAIDSNGRFSHTNYKIDVEVSENMGIAELDKMGIKVYPNPIQSELNIQLDSGKSRLIIHDIHGKQMLDTVVDQTAKIDLSHLSAGIYTAYFWKEANKIYVVKLIKQ
ncbi:T9SS type A sorting domain-containing protein [Flavobacterium caeni]|uniref:Por secretion system C-terminal sorting domain-containing protein n=1 Tax=Flavobacterium caeni TaxID=490189 RepID=A0A1G5GWL2_9FLAO|nr:T9SS type A sorting domain-containing protein [Flavobacterium caeni]SCY55992.1 Por secretion system C-terminal sorting domain-containing protein [Flavobacterium caeni]